MGGNHEEGDGKNKDVVMSWCLQLIGWTGEGSDGGSLFGAVETRMADATALASIQQFVKAHTADLLQCGSTVAAPGKTVDPATVTGREPL